MEIIHYGVREHGMAAVMNGLALYGGIIPYGGTFLIFLIIVNLYKVICIDGS